MFGRFSYLPRPAPWWLGSRSGREALKSSGGSALEQALSPLLSMGNAAPVTPAVNPPISAGKLGTDAFWGRFPKPASMWLRQMATNRWNAGPSRRYNTAFDNIILAALKDSGGNWVDWVAGFLRGESPVYDESWRFPNGY